MVNPFERRQLRRTKLSYPGQSYEGSNGKHLSISVFEEGKREERKRKNRESAQQSRDRKSFYVRNLEIENQRLKEENVMLKRRLEAILGDSNIGEKRFRMDGETDRRVMEIVMPKKNSTAANAVGDCGNYYNLNLEPAAF